ncbi:MAG: hypothetical protein VYB54_00205 [Pseudomonadota bacterium]|nr:hypothetical protein [Pseudomonadota bacterium]
MFHAYVFNSLNRAIDLNRAQFLMDRDLALQAIDDTDGAVAEAPAGAAPAPGGEWSASDQAFYNRYTALHRSKYGRPFPPDVDPDWS